MLKKVLAIVLLCGSLMTGCATQESEEIRDIGNFISFKEIQYYDINIDGDTQYYVYDKDTKIVYLYFKGTYSTSLCPYYITNDNGEVVHALYFDGEIIPAK